MAYIRKIERANGVIKYAAEIFIKKEGVILHRESKTFDKQKQAKDWATLREAKLMNSSIYGEPDYLPIKDIINAYLKQFSVEGRTKRYDILQLGRREVAKIDVHKLRANDLIKHIKARNTECKPQTAKNDMIWLKQVIMTMRSVFGYKFDPSIFSEANDILRRERLVAKSTKRDRMPTFSEILRISRTLRKRGGDVPMYDLYLFALSSARRQAEITRLEWSDINFEKQTGLVRDAKHPTQKKGNDKRFKFERKAWQIVLRQPRDGRYVFPYNSKTIGTYFRDTCVFLGITGLTWHDARHYATSRLFRKGYSIEQVQQFTLHDDWKNLARYTHIKPEDIY